MSGIVLCEVFRSSKHEGMYLYVGRSEGLRDVPETLMEMFGLATSVMVFKLTETRPLGRASAPEVLEAIAEQGYYLQTPPGNKAELDIKTC